MKKELERKIYCPVCTREFGSFRAFKNHLSSTWYEFIDSDKKHLELQGRYRHITTKMMRNADSPIYDKPLSPLTQEE